MNAPHDGKDLENEALQQMLEEQKRLAESAEATAKLMRFVLQVASENLLVIKDNLLAIHQLIQPAEPDDDNTPDDKAS